jgi:hypothetical protein
MNTQRLEMGRLPYVGRGALASVVVEVGSERYTVADPGQMCGEYIYGMTVKWDFEILKRIRSSRT